MVMRRNPWSKKYRRASETMRFAVESLTERSCGCVRCGRMTKIVNILKKLYQYHEFPDKWWWSQPEAPCMRLVV